MFTRHGLLLLTVLLLASTLGFSQGHGGGGGGGGGTKSSGAPATGSQPYYTPPVDSGSSFSNIVAPHTAGEEGKIEFRTQTILVQVPVVVTDKSGNHIHGLTKDDFRLMENRKDQKVSTFEELVASNSQLPVAALKPGQFGNLTLSEEQPRTVTVIALDTVNTQKLNLMSQPHLPGFQLTRHGDVNGDKRFKELIALIA